MSECDSANLYTQSQATCSILSLKMLFNRIIFLSKRVDVEISQKKMSQIQFNDIY